MQRGAQFQAKLRPHQIDDIARQGASGRMQKTAGMSDRCKT